MPTLEDVLLDEIVADPAGPVPKLALADLLGERGLDAEADAARWCAGHGRWPYPLPRRGNAGWQWLRPGCPPVDPEKTRAVLPPSLAPAMDFGTWWSPSWLGALALLADALTRHRLLSAPTGGRPGD